MRIRTLLIAASAAAIFAAPAVAHRMWLLPSTTVLADVGQWVTIDAAVSNDLFYADHVPMQIQQIKVWAPDGSAGQIENAATGKYRSTFDVKIDKPGTWKIGTEASSIQGTFKLNGEEWRVGGRRGGGSGGPGGMAPGARPAGAATPAANGAAPTPPVRQSVGSVDEIPAGATDIKLTEVLARNYVFISAGEPTTSVFGSAKGLDMQPVTHPTALVSDEAGQFRFLVDGKPAAGVKVTVVPGSKKFRAAEQAQELTTGADGLLRVTWPVAGVYWISANLTDARPSNLRATERRMTYTTTVEVPAP
jgi:uncharacterized GH25 family protein